MTTATKARPKSAAKRASGLVLPRDIPDGVPVADDCDPKMLQACRTRVCLLDVDGSPLTGASSMVVSDALVKLTYTPNYKAGTELTESNACDEVVVDYLGPPSLVRYDIDIDFLSPDPYLLSVLLSQGAILAPGGGGVGFAAPPIGTVNTNGISIELWVKRVVDGVLSVTDPYMHWAFPFVKNLQEGAREFSNTVHHGLVSGQAFENANWFDGPGDDFDAASTRGWQYIPTDTLPDVVCGFVEVAGS